MARKAKAAEAETEKAVDKPKFGVDNLTEDLGLAPASVRVKLRNLGIEKSGRSYGWNTQKDYAAVLKQLKADVKESAPKGDADGDETAKPKRGRRKVKADA